MLRITLSCLVLSCFFLSSHALSETVRFRFDATNSNGDVVENLRVGDTFFLNAYTQDVGPDPAQGVFAAYLDVMIDPPIASIVGPVEAGVDYQNASDKGEVSVDLFDNFGGFTSALEPLGADERLIFSQEMQADALGEIEFMGVFANESPAFDVLRFGDNTPVLAADIDFGSLTLQIAEVPEPSGGVLFCLGAVALLVSRRRK